MTRKRQELNPGDRIALTAQFLRDTGQRSNGAGERRGTFLRYEGPMARVHWDDEAAYISSGQGQYSQADYCDEVRTNGAMVHGHNICRTGPNSYFAAC